MVSASDVILKYVCPSLGVIIASATFSAPVKSLRRALKKGSLNGLNTYPWAFMTGTCLGWTAYSFVEFNLFVFFANAPGFLLSFWLNGGALKLQYLEQMKPYIDHDASSSSTANGTADGENGMVNEDMASQSSQQQNYRHGGSGPTSFVNHDKLWLLVVLTWIIILSVIGLSSSITHDTAKNIIGISSNVFLVAFFAAPLSTIFTVIKSRDTASIHVRTMIMNTFNCVFWFAYALAIRDVFIAIPNGLGLLFGLVQVFLYVTFPRSDGGLERVRTEEEEAMEDGLMMENSDDGDRSVGSDGSAGTELKRKSSMIEDKSII